MESKTRNKLVVFDVEGVLIPKVRFILFEVVGRMGSWSFIKAAFLGILYELGLIHVKSVLKRLYRLFEGLALDQFLSLFQRVPLMPEVEGVFKELREYGFKIALISSGIPTVALEKLRERLRADYVSGFEIGLFGGRLTGEIWGDVIEPDGKAAALRRILAEERLSPCYCVGVADDRNNLSMLQLCDLKIGYNPDFVLSRESDYVIRGDLSKVLSIVRGEPAEVGAHHVGLAKSNLPREAIHMGGFLVPLICAHLVNRHVIALFISIAILLYAMSEVLRMRGVSVPLIGDVTNRATEKSEFQEFVASPIFYAFGIVLSLVFFPETISYVSVAVLTLGDGSAAIFGERFGKTHVPFNKIKNLEGTVCGLFFAFSGSLLFADPQRALIGSLVGMLVEILPSPINDNLTIPAASGLALIAGSMFLHI